MEIEEDIVIVGAGIAGLATSLGLHRLGLRSLILESSDSLRTTGYAFTTWMNAWKALDALGIGDYLRQHHVQIQRMIAGSTATGLTTSEMSFIAQGKCGNHEVRCVMRNLLLETLAKELPQGTIRFGSKIVSIDKSNNIKLVYFADGSILKAKVLIGCDGVNSVVAKWLGLQKPAFTGRSAIRGLADFPDGHALKPQLLQFFGNGFRSGFLPCNDKTIYWFFTYSSSSQTKDMEASPAMMKQFVLSKLTNVPEKIIDALERTDLSTIFSSPLRFRYPWDVLWGNICKDGVCVAGDALHPMTPDIGQGGCAALEDGVTLARCLGEALLMKSKDDEEEEDRIKKGLEKYAKERRWRSFELISTAYVLGFIQQSQGALMNFIRDKCLSRFMAGMLLKKADFDCGKLQNP